MKAEEIFHKKQVLRHCDGLRLAIFEICIWEIPTSDDYPEGVKYRAWLSEEGCTLFGFDNHRPKGPHIHVGHVQIGYIFIGIDVLRNDVIAMIGRAGFIHEE